MVVEDERLVRQDSDRENYLRKNKLNYRSMEDEVSTVDDYSDVHISSTLELTARRETRFDEALLSPSRDALAKSVDGKKSLSATANSLPLGRANALSNEELVELLRRPPKLVAELRTKSTFQAFFSGIYETRMRLLLEEAYRDHDDRNLLGKVEKRLALMKDFMV
jgi:hypothetical protein